MNPLIGYGILSGVGSLASSLFNTFTGQKQSKDLMDYQYQLQQQAIDRQNLYNSPAEQMKRLASAQLNPNLVYGNGVDGNQSSAASPSIANRKGEMANPVSDIGQAYLQNKQLELEQIRARNEAFESRSRRLLNDAKTIGQLMDNKLFDRTFDTKVRMASQKLANEVVRESILNQQSNNMRLQAAVLNEQADNIASQTGLNKERALTEVVKRRALEAGIRVSEMQAKELGKMIEFIGAGTKLREGQYNIQQTAYDAAKIYQKWKADHPKTTLTLDIVKEILGMGKDIAEIGGKIVVP